MRSLNLSLIHIWLSGKVAAVNNQGEFYIDSQYKGNITVTASDNSGNVSDAMVTEYIIVDKEKPTVPVITAEGYTPGEWISSEIAIKAENSTALSGIKAYEYSTDGGAAWTVMQVESMGKGTYMEPGRVVSANLKVDETGIHTYEFRALSNSGIYSDVTGKMEVRMDQEKPAVLVRCV